MEETAEKTRKGIKVKEIVFLIILVLIAIFLVRPIKNFVIITRAENVGKQYANSSNHYYSVIYTDKDNNAQSAIEWYKKDNKTLRIQQAKSGEYTNKMMVFDNGKRVDVFREQGEQKTASLNNATFSEMLSYEISYGMGTYNNIWGKILYCMKANLKTVDYNGVKCYKYTKVDEENTTWEVYTEKETGLLKAAISNKLEMTITYQADNVSDDVFVEPDVGQYILVNDII